MSLCDDDGVRLSLRRALLLPYTALFKIVIRVAMLREDEDCL